MIVALQIGLLLITAFCIVNFIFWYSDISSLNNRNRTQQQRNRGYKKSYTKESRKYSVSYENPPRSNRFTWNFPKPNRTRTVINTPVIKLQGSPIDGNLEQFGKLLPIVISRWENTSQFTDIVNASGYNACTSQGIFPGRWSRLTSDVNSSSDSFHCCNRQYTYNYSSTESDHCGPQENRVEIVKMRIHFQGSKYYNMGDESGCMCSSTIQHEWLPASGCEISQWNASLFCNLLGNRTLLLVGDSTMRQSAATLISLVASFYRMSNQSSESCSDQIHYGSSDVLVANYHDSLSHRQPLRRKFERGLSLREHLSRVTPDIAILTAGPHFYDNNEYHNYFLKKLQQELDDLRIWQNVSSINPSSNFRHQFHLPNSTKPLSIVWKTINPGHTRCMAHANESLILSNLTHLQYPAPDEFFWYLHPHFDDATINLFKSMNIPVIDMRPLYYRADAHPAFFHDCLHYCMPGVLDLFARELLMLLQSSKIQ